MHPNAKLIARFYTAFASLDSATMAACYSAQATFSDPVFPDLRGNQIGAMWTMLCSQSTDLAIRFDQVVADDTTGAAHWDADYTFSQTHRMVNNRIDATFTFQDGKILRHVDHFSFAAWSRMALGPAGWLLGWTPIVQNKVRSQAAKALRKWTAQAD